MVVTRISHRNMKPPVHPPQRFDWQRHFVGIAAIILGIVALVGKFGLGLSDVGAEFMMGSFGKASMVLGLAWLAWPQLLLLKKMPGGGIAIASVLICIVVFIMRPKLLLYFVPLLGSITALLVAITWVQRNLLPPKR
jgi:hypothetical protein